MEWNNLSRKEKIEVYRGILQTLGILVMVVGLVWMMKHFDERKIMGECAYVVDEINITYTGLYGNCTWLNQEDKGLQNNYYVNQGEGETS